MAEPSPDPRGGGPAPGPGGPGGAEKPAERGGTHVADELVDLGRERARPRGSAGRGARARRDGGDAGQCVRSPATRPPPRSPRPHRRRGGGRRANGPSAPAAFVEAIGSP